MIWVRETFPLAIQEVYEVSDVPRFLFFRFFRFVFFFFTFSFSRRFFQRFFIARLRYFFIVTKI